MGEQNKPDMEAFLEKLQLCKFSDCHDSLGKSNVKSDNDNFIIMRKNLTLSKHLYINYF